MNPVGSVDEPLQNASILDSEEDRKRDCNDLGSKRNDLHASVKNNREMKLAFKVFSTTLQIDYV